MNESPHLSDESCSTSLRAPEMRTRFGNHIQVFWLAITISAAAALLAPTETSAQRCRGNIQIGCTNAGAVCSPVQVGIGSSGHCKTPPGLPRGERTCECVGTPAADPCSDRTVSGKIVCTIEQPVVTRPETQYPRVVFAPDDIVEVKADGCVQTGGRGKTWKRYVNPTGELTDKYYHGMIRIPTGTKDSALIRIKTVIGRHLRVTGIGVPESQLVLHLGYEDNDYSDNGYSDHDDGTGDQCKIGGSNDGGPAHVTITIFRGVPPEPPQSRFDFDVLSDRVDPNELPFNPEWSWQRRNKGQIPKTSMCHEFSARDILKVVPNFPDCTDQTDLIGVDLPKGWNGRACRLKRGGPFITGSFVGHVNWFPVTVEGSACGVHHQSFPLGDDDYTFSFYSDLEGSPLSVNPRPGRANVIHAEFDSDETIDYFQSNEWQELRDAVDVGSDVSTERLFNGHTILTGMFGLDGEHDLKAELHPVYAMALRRDFGFDPKNDVWLMFVRNLGNEGFCSSQLWDAEFEDYTFRLPWLDGMTDVDVVPQGTHFFGPPGLPSPIVAKRPPPVRPCPARGCHWPGGEEPGVYVTFHIGPPGTSPFLPSTFIEGRLTLTWTGQSPVMKPSCGPAARTEPEVEADEAEHGVKAAVDQLTPAQRQAILEARAPPAVQPDVRPLPMIGPIQLITARTKIEIGGLEAIKAGPATQKAAQYEAQWRTLCAVTHDASPGFPAGICKRRHPR